MNIEQQIETRIEVILEQSKLMDRINSLRIGDLSNWETDFIKSIQNRFFTTRKLLTENQINALVNILAWQEIDIS